MLRKILIAVSFSAFIGVSVASLLDHSVPQLENYRTALFRGQGFMVKVICSGSSRLADQISYTWWRHAPRTWSLFGGKVRIEISKPTTCSTPGCSLSLAQPSASAEDSEVRIVLDAS
jgi:hypothetical protein